jgi:TB2/DP1, HVA22 family
MKITFTMIELPKEKILTYGISLALLIGLIVVSDKFIQPKRTRGRNIVFHVLYLVGVVAVLVLVPSDVQNEIFSPFGVLMIGTIVPIYESIRAICSISSVDDTTWLQYWITSATISFSTEFIDDITRYLPNAGEHWYELEFILYLWLLLPYTDGATLIYDVFTKPYCSPIATRIKVQCEGYIGLLLTLANTSYIYIIWYSLIYLPEGSKRFLVVALGTVYPITASLVAVTTETTPIDDTVWLTYWTTYSILFILMDYLENFIGNVPGFYSLCAIATVYLFLPMFNGSEIIFRRILVPLSGQYENMLLHDAYLVKQGMIQAIPTEHRERLFEKTAHIFLKA